MAISVFIINVCRENIRDSGEGLAFISISLRNLKCSGRYPRLDIVTPIGVLILKPSYILLDIHNQSTPPWRKDSGLLENSET